MSDAEKQIDRCASCGARIIWAKMESGKAIPLNYVRVQTYYRRSGDTWAPILEEDTDKPALRHISHFVSCPNAAQHSKRGQE